MHFLSFFVIFKLISSILNILARLFSRCIASNLINWEAAKNDLFKWK